MSLSPAPARPRPGDGGTAAGNSGDVPGAGSDPAAAATRRLLQRAVALLARREHSRAELARKLQRRLDEGDDPALIDRVLDDLQRRDLLSEQRFAQALVRARGQRYGDARLKADLKARGASPQATADALAAVRGSELQRAHALWLRRFGAVPATAQERGRQGRFLQARGFSSEVIRKVLAGGVAKIDPEG
jgi:regulatory protein